MQAAIQHQASVAGWLQLLSSKRWQVFIRNRDEREYFALIQEGRDMLLNIMNCILCGVHHNGLFIWVTWGGWNKYVHTFQRHFFKTSNHHISFTLDNILHLTKHEIIRQIRSQCLFEDLMYYSKEGDLHILKIVSKSKMCVTKTLAQFCNLS